MKKNIINTYFLVHKAKHDFPEPQLLERLDLKGFLQSPCVYIYCDLKLGLGREAQASTFTSSY